MWVCKRQPGESVEMEVSGFTNVIRLTRVIDGKHAWISVNGDAVGPLPTGSQVAMAGNTAILMTVIRFKGQEVTLGFNAPQEVKLRAANTNSNKE